MCAHYFFHIESGLSQKKIVDKGETFQQKTGRSLYKTHPNVIECHEMSWSVMNCPEKYMMCKWYRRYRPQWNPMKGDATQLWVMFL